MALADGDVVQVQFKGVCFAQQIRLVRNFQIIGNFPPGNTIQQDLDLILTAVTNGGVADIETPYLALLPSTYALPVVTAQRIWPVRSVARPITLVGAVGTNAGGASSANHTASITFQTPNAGRTQRGTIHIGPAPDSASALGFIVNAYFALLLTLTNRLLTAFTPPTSGSIVAPVLYNRKTHITSPVTSAQVQPTSRVQRRRTVGVGI